MKCGQMTRLQIVLSRFQSILFVFLKEAFSPERPRRFSEVREPRLGVPDLCKLSVVQLHRRKSL